VNAKYLVIGLMQTYRHKNLKKGTVNAVAGYLESKKAIDAVYASNRLKLPFEGLLIFGY
jgi:hypothetical protein